MDARDGETEFPDSLKRWLWGVRTRVNLLLANGHPDAWFYPLGLLHDEAVLVLQRMNASFVAQAVGFRTAYISARIKEGDQLMGEYINRLTGE